MADENTENNLENQEDIQEQAAQKQPAQEKSTEEQTTQEQPAQEKSAEEQASQQLPEAKHSGSGILQWIIMAVVIMLCAGAGFGLGRFFAGSSTANPNQSEQQTPQNEKNEDLKADGSEEGKSWFYDLDPVVANLDVPGATRYVRASLTLEISSEIDQAKGAAFIDEKKPVLVNWLAIYLASLTLDDVTGEANLKRIQSEIRDAYNEELFPDSKPQVEKVLLKEFPIQ